MGGLLKTKAWYSNDKYLLKKTSFDNMVSLVIDAVPPPFCPPLVENKKLKFGGEASVRTTGASVPSHVSVRRLLSKLLSKITSFMIKDLFKKAHVQHFHFNVCGERVLIMSFQKNSPGCDLSA